jgi:hypothetical protein
MLRDRSLTVARIKIRVCKPSDLIDSLIGIFIRIIREFNMFNFSDSPSFVYAGGLSVGQSIGRMTVRRTIRPCARHINIQMSLNGLCVMANGHRIFALGAVICSTVNVTLCDDVRV